MKIHLDYRRPTLRNCDVAVFVNGELAGTLTLRQSELIGFQHILNYGLGLRDEFLATGNPEPHAATSEERKA